jgi:hypothetical protein
MDVERWVNIFDANAVSHDPVGTPPMHGHEALRQFLTQVNSGFHSLGRTQDNVFINGNSAAVKWTGKGIGRNGQIRHPRGRRRDRVQRSGKNCHRTRLLGPDTGDGNSRELRR